MKKTLTAIVLSLMLILVSVFASACAKEELSAPSGISIDDSYRITWNDVTGASSYEISIVPEEGERVVDSVRRPTYSLADLAVGDYEITIRAIGGASGYADSVWTDTIFFHREYENGCLYESINNGTEYQVTGYGTSEANVELGGLYRGKPVTRINNAAFRNSRRVENVVILDGVTYIGDSAFQNCTNLVSITIPDSVVYIGENAFQTCAKLNNVVIPDSITEIKARTFSYCRALTNITIPDSVVYIGQSAFSSCSALTSMEIPAGVTYIEKDAFLQCTGLTHLTIGDNVEQIGESAFSYCTSLTDITFSDIGALKSLGNYTFSNCLALASVTLPDGLESIGEGAFLEDEMLRDVSIPDSVSDIGVYAFLYTGIYNDVITDENAGPYIYADNWLVELNENNLLEIKTVSDDSIGDALKDENFVPLKDGIVGVADNVFQSTNVEQVILPDSVKYIGDQTFAFCEKLWSFRVADSYYSDLLSLGRFAFYKCTVLSNISLGSKLESIDAYAFYGCTRVVNNNISEASFIPDSVNHIGMMAFYDTGLYSEADEFGVIYVGNWAIGFNGYENSMQYMYAKYGETDGDPIPLPDLSTLSQVSYIKLKDNVRGVADFAFFGHVNLTQIDGIQNVRYLGQAAFFGCEGLRTVTLNRNLREIPDFTFFGCYDLLDLSIPSMVTRIGRSAFNNCRSLTRLELGAGELQEIGDFAFYNCQNIEELNFGNYLESIGRYAFYNTASVTEVTLPDSLVSIGDRAFYYNSSLENLTIGENVVTIGDYAFGQCTELRSIVIPDSVQTIGNYAFYGCTNVTSLSIGSNVATIGNYAFARLTNLLKVSIPASVHTLGAYVFRGCSNLQAVVVPESVEVIGEHAFFGCNSATIYVGASTIGGEWEDTWNSSRRPVVWGCTFAEDGSLVSVTITADTLSFVNELNSTNAPVRAGYDFAGWATSQNSQDVAYKADEIVNAPVGTTLYAVWVATQA